MAVLTLLLEVLSSLVAVILLFILEIIHHVTKPPIDPALTKSQTTLTPSQGLTWKYFDNFMHLYSYPTVHSCQQKLICWQPIYCNVLNKMKAVIYIACKSSLFLNVLVLIQIPQLSKSSCD